MFSFDMDSMMDRDVTATPFRAMVSEEAPFRFADCLSKDVQASVRITHMTYTPPTSQEEWDAYYAAHPDQPKPSLGGSTVYTVGEIKTFTASKKVETFVLACFPLDTNRVCTLDTASASAAAVSGPDFASESLVRFGRFFDVVVPAPSDIASALNIRFTPDGYTELLVRGPGHVTFFGEQLSALIPEWANHRFFTVNDEDEEEEVLDDE